MPGQPDYYETLQVHPSAEPEIIQAAYRRLSLKYHPDVYHGPDAQRRMAQLNEAYAVLQDPKQRATYDRQRFGARSPIAARTAPVLQLAPREVDFGTTAPGRNRTFSIRLRNIGQGSLSGLIVSHVPWLQVSPTEFSGNDLDIVLRFQSNAKGEYWSANAAEVYSNGGRATVAVRGRVQAPAPAGLATASPAPPPPPLSATRERPVAKRPPASVAKTPWPKVRLPFMVWVFLGTALSTAIWFQIAPFLTAVPIGLGVWLAWEHLVMRKSVLEQEQDPRPGSRQGRAALARCLVCNSSLDPGRSHKCRRCGGPICRACGACACRGPGPGPRAPGAR